MATTEAGLETIRAAPDHPRIIHFQQYNVALQHAVLEADRIDPRAILERSAAEVVHRHLTALPGWAERGAGDRLAEAAELFRESGLGVLDVSGLGPDGGQAAVTGSHFALGWVQRYGKPAQPICLAAAGYLRGALAAAFQRGYAVAESECAARGGERCHFAVRALPDAVDLGEAEVRPAPARAVAPRPHLSTVDEDEIVAALFGGPLAADAGGRIDAFGASLTRLWADFYGKVSFRFEREVPRVMGGKFSNLASVVLTEAGHVCAFHSLGSILRSEEWRTRVEPLLASREDAVHALVAVINALGWGVWRVHGFQEGERLSVRVYEGYEGASYRRHFERSETPRCYQARGAAGAIMNLLYVGDFGQRPELTPSLYNQLFRSPLSFRAVETRCRAMDDPYCELVVNPLSPSLSSRFSNW